MSSYFNEKEKKEYDERASKRERLAAAYHTMAIIHGKEFSEQLEKERELNERANQLDPIEERYAAQHRFFQKNKLSQALIRITGKYKKFKKMWFQAGSFDPEEKKEAADELNKMFR